MPRPDVSEERRNQVLDAAIKVFARLGFHKASMDNIAQEADMSKGLLYWYFKSKDAIIAAILNQFFALEQRDLAILEDKSLPATERLLRYNEELVGKTKYLIKLMPIALEFYALAARQESVRGLTKEYFRVYRDKFTTLIQDGIDRGEFKAVDPSQAALTLLTTYEGTFALAAIDPGAFEWQSQTTSAIRLFLDGLKNPTS